MAERNLVSEQGLDGGINIQYPGLIQGITHTAHQCGAQPLAALLLVHARQGTAHSIFADDPAHAQRLRRYRVATQCGDQLAVGGWLAHPRPSARACAHPACLPPWPSLLRGPLLAYVLIHPLGECAQSVQVRVNAGFLPIQARATAGFRSNVHKHKAQTGTGLSEPLPVGVFKGRAGQYQSVCVGTQLFAQHG